ncbi:hypothetical protein HX109_15955 [Galbibacter sp. BG1]|uniref:hypothetical protein n=1 Tax=Galbibacter sp. BG1 TaxID=1170699 RepID=UPI0015B98FB5|nr:hypothetical protein [Galbibacter sp. BG1]QLE02989.1 hypothetical protein HX109_15955 [Galbibacter sp. BG1]
MKTNFLKGIPFILLSVLILGCAQSENHLAHETVDISKKKLTPELAEKLSKRFVKDIEDLFAKADSLEYYKNLLEQIQNQANQAGAQRSVKIEPVTFQKKKPKFNLSVSSWYSTDELLTYLNESIKHVKEKGGEVDGFRIYIGVFPNEEGKKSNTLTTFINPTGRMGADKQEGSVVPNLIKPLFFQAGGHDLLDVPPLEYGGSGEPPSSSYPQ